MANLFLYAVLNVSLDISVNVFWTIPKHPPAAPDSYRRDAEPCHGPLAFYL
jgi:hypothetical protein